MRGKKKFLAVFLCLALVLGFAPCAMASTTGHVYVNVKQDYSAAKQMLKKINKARSARGLRTLKLDKSLTAAAVTRAAEVAIVTPTGSPHRRPNGALAKTVNGRISYECAAESCWGSVDLIFNDWMNSPVHKAGILRSSARCVGISCTTVENQGESQQVWMLDFSDTSCKKAVKAKSVKSFTKKVTVLNSKVSSKKLKLWDISTGSKSSTTIELDSTTKFTPTYRNAYLKWNVPLRAKSFTWKSSNKSVVTVSAAGKVTAHKLGTATVTAKLKDGTKASVKMKVKVVDLYD